MNCSLTSRAKRCCIGVCALFAAAGGTAGASEFEYIFWGKISAQNLRLSAEEFHLSRAMHPAASWREYEPSCALEIPAASGSAGAAGGKATGAGAAGAAGKTPTPETAAAEPAPETAATTAGENPLFSQNPAPKTAAAKFRAKLAADEPIFRALLANKAALIDCAKDAQIRHKTTANRLAAATSTRLALLPFRFRAEADTAGKITIYARKNP